MGRAGTIPNQIDLKKTVSESVRRAWNGIEPKHSVHLIKFFDVP